MYDIFKDILKNEISDGYLERFVFVLKNLHLLISWKLQIKIFLYCSWFLEVKVLKHSGGSSHFIWGGTNIMELHSLQFSFCVKNCCCHHHASCYSWQLNVVWCNYSFFSFLQYFFSPIVKLDLYKLHNEVDHLHKWDLLFKRDMAPQVPDMK